MTEEDYEQLLEMVKELRMLLLFEEPCPLYEEIEDGME